MQTSQSPINLPESELLFLKQYAQKNKTSISELIDQWIKSLLTKPAIHPDIAKLSGITPGNIDVDKAITDYLMEKHRDEYFLKPVGSDEFSDFEDQTNKYGRSNE